VPFQNPGGASDNYARQLIENLAIDLNSKNWIDSIVQQNPTNEDYVVSGKIAVEGSSAVTLISLNAPGGKNLWSFKVGGNMGNISALASQTSSQMASQIFLEIMKVRGKY
jgi:outer membrane protein assembly factor BamB